MTTRICIWGAWYESKNAGDQAILMAIAQLLADRLPQAALTVFSNRPALTESYLRALRLENLQTRAISQRYQLPQTIKALCRSDLFLVGGGTPIYDDRFHLFSFWLLVTLARLSGVKIMTYAISARAIRDPINRRICRLILKSIPVLTVRETSSLSIIRDLLRNPAKEIEVYTDPVVTFQRPPASLPSELAEMIQQEWVGEPQLVAICPHFFSASHKYHVHHYDRLQPDEIAQYYSIMAQVCDRLLERAALVFLPLNTEEPDNDLAAIQAIRERMKHGQGATTGGVEISPEQIVTVLRSCRLVLGTRLHSLVFASVVRTPMVSISYGPKADGYMETLGLGAYNHRLKELSTEALWTSVDQAWNHYRQLRDHLTQRMVELETLAGANADRAIGLVTAQKRQQN